MWNSFVYSDLRLLETILKLISETSWRVFIPTIAETTREFFYTNEQ